MRLLKLAIILFFPLLNLRETSYYTTNQNLLSVSGDPVKIGLLIPDNKSLAAVRAAELAVNKANQSGGLKGRPFKIVVRSLEGPWGTGSKQAVDMIFNEKVWALMGSHDGRNAHLVEQSATKATVVFLSNWAGDPSLSQAFVPWFFNCVHNDDQQAAAIISGTVNNNQIKKITVVTDDDDYDSRVSFAAFEKASGEKGKTKLIILPCMKFLNDLNALTEKIQESDPDYVLLFCRPEISTEILLLMKKLKMSQTIAGPIYIINEDKITPDKMKQIDNYFLVPSDKINVSALKQFKTEYEKKYGALPGQVAYYAYDGINVLMEAIKKAGSSDREKIQKALFETDYMGITGRIRFDERGNRTGNLYLTRIVNGTPAQYPDEMPHK